MWAAVYSSYGPPEVVQIREVEKPAPGLNEILILVHATTLCPADWRYRKADPSLSRLFSGLFRPTKIRILGMEFAGTVDAAGQSVTRFRVGDQVFGTTGFQTMGAHAEYLCVNQPVVVQAVEAVDRFHSGVKQQRYQDMCQAAESHAFSGATNLPCPEYLVYFHQKLGAPVSARRTQLPLIGDRRPDGTVRVGLDYETDYEHGTAHEHFEWRIMGNTVILTSYRVEADALSH